MDSRTAKSSGDKPNQPLHKNTAMPSTTPRTPNKSTNDYQSKLHHVKNFQAVEELSMKGDGNTSATDQNRSFATPVRFPAPGAETITIGDRAQVKDADLTRLPVAIPANNIIFDNARKDVRHPTHDFSELFNKYGFTAVVDAAFDQSRRSDHPFFTSDEDTPYQELSEWRFHGVQILADTPRSILESLLDETLTEKVAGDAPSHRILQDYFDASNYEAFISRPTGTMTAPNVNRWIKRHKEQLSSSFYVRILVNSKGASPTPAQLRRVVKRMRQYISNDPSYVDICVDIDNAKRHNTSDRENIMQRQHFFLNGSLQRLQVVLTFCEALEDLLQTHAPAGSPQESQPFKFKAKYFGYTTNDAERSKRHDAGTTNWLKSFYHSICKTEFHDPTGTPDFTWHHYVIGFAVSVDECHIGEELFCQIGSGYYNTGVGFNIQSAGISVSSAQLDSVNSKNAANMWKAVLQWREEGPDFTDQLAHEIQTCVPAYKQYVNAKRDANRNATKTRKDLIETRARLIKEIEDEKAAGPQLSDITAAIQGLENSQKQTLATCADQPELQAILRQSHANVLDRIKASARELYELE